MKTNFPGVYIPTNQPNVYESTPLANAGWYDEGQHGGAFTALVAGHLETIPTLADMEVSRITVELFRVVPIVPLRIEHDVVREGKKIQTITARVFDPADSLLSIVTMQRLRVTPLDLPDDIEPLRPDLPPPEPQKAALGEAWGVGDPNKVMFHRHAMEVQDSVGGFATKGPGAVWMRLLKPVIADRPNSAVQRIVATADFANGVSRALDMDTWVFMNPDLTIHITRYPEGEWIGLSAESSYGSLGRGVATGRIWDTSGFVGRSTQTLFLDRLGN